MRVKHIILHAVNVAHGVVGILFTGKFGCDVEHLLTCIRNNHCAVALKDGREIGDGRLKFNFIFEWFAANKGIHVGG